jgi:hypothetical protein
MPVIPSTWRPRLEDHAVRLARAKNLKNIPEKQLKVKRAGRVSGLKW